MYSGVRMGALEWNHGALGGIPHGTTGARRYTSSRGRDCRTVRYEMHKVQLLVFQSAPGRE
jgi:hypothetical protein